MGHAGLGVGVEHRKIELVLGGVEIDKQIVDFIEDGSGTGVGTIDFIQNDDRRKLRLQGFLQDVARLGQRSFAGVDQEEHAVHHAQGALDFTAEIAVAGRIHDIDARVVIEERCILGQDGDAALALEVIGVHDALDQRLITAKDATLAQHGVHEGGLAVVDVSDDGDIANAVIHT